MGESLGLVDRLWSLKMSATLYNLSHQSTTFSCSLPKLKSSSPCGLCHFCVGDKFQNSKNALVKNDFIEHDSIIIMEATRNILHARGLPKFLWAEAVNIVVHVLNHTTTRTLSGSMPYELWTTDNLTFHIFECLVALHSNMCWRSFEQNWT
jgi:hypothetical protein